ncbi:MAG: S-layer homology domain-containing protein [Acidimicrobiales bacterium]|nr:S-layer homology domain-containing protein [Acidimicrobiales bacterium]
MGGGRRGRTGGILVVFAFVLAVAAPASASWERTFGGTDGGNVSSAHGVEFLTDGSTVVVGIFQGTFLGLTAVDGWDFFMMRIDVDGDVQWSRSWDADKEYDQAPGHDFVFAVDGNDRSYLSVQGDVESGTWVVEGDGTVVGAPLASSSDPAGRYPEAMFSRDSGIAVLERVDGSSDDAPYSLTFRDEDLALESTIRLDLGQPDFGVIQGGDGWGRDLLLVRAIETDVLFPEQGVDLELTRLTADGDEVWSRTYEDFAERFSDPYVLLRADDFLVPTEISGARGVSSFSSASGALRNAALSGASTSSLVLTPSTCVGRNGPVFVAATAACDEFAVFRRDYWSNSHMSRHVAPMPDGRFAVIGRIDRGNDYESDSVAILDSDGDDLLSLVRAAIVIEESSSASVLTAVAADPATGRVVAVGREGEPGVGASALVVSDLWGHGFVDVTLDGWQSEPIEWLRASRLTTGCSASEFCPSDEMPREQLVTFLYRYRGEPPPGSSAPFVDVPNGKYYTDAISWAYNSDVTTGVGGGRFGTGETVTRAQAVTFLWRDAGSPSPDADADFSDVPSGEFYSDAVAWAAESAVTTGFPDGTFRPGDPVTREQFAAFFQRYDRVA